MRIVILYNSSWYVFLLRSNLIASLLRSGHSVTVVAPEDAYSERVRQLGVSLIPINITRSGTSVWKELLTIAELYTILRRVSPDVVLSFTVKCNLYAGLCKRRLAFRQVANISGLGQLFDETNTFRRIPHLLYRISLARTEEIFFQNPEDMEHLTRCKTVSRERATLIPGSGVDLVRFCPTETRRGSTRTFLMFGRLLPKKGFSHFIRAAQELQSKYGDKVSFWILGAPDQEREESLELFKSVLSAHASGIIRYLHATDNPLPYIREADSVVLPSTYNEGVPRSLLEALACGKPIVTTDWKGCRETVEDGRNGFLVLPGSTGSLIDALDKLVVCDRALLAAFGERSRQIAEERFDEQLVIASYHRVVEGDTRDFHISTTFGKEKQRKRPDIDECRLRFNANS